MLHVPHPRQALLLSPFSHVPMFEADGQALLSLSTFFQPITSHIVRELTPTTCSPPPRAVKP